MNITFWGTRGSIPTPQPDRMKYGGNTACLGVTLQDDERILILDAGTGIRELGLELVKRRERIKIGLLLTHFHWDHLQGIPFFAPLYVKQCECTFVGCDLSGEALKKRLQDALGPPYFPVDFDVFQANVDFIDHCESELDVGPFRVGVIPIHHPGGCLAYRITAGQRTVVYMTDHELDGLEQKGKVYQHLVDFCGGVDLLVHDAQYTPEEYAKKRGWGHSSYTAAVDFAATCGVKRLALFHHDPEHDDGAVDSIVQKSQQALIEKGSSIDCFAAREGLVMTW